MQILQINKKKKGCSFIYPPQTPLPDSCLFFFSLLFLLSTGLASDSLLRLFIFLSLVFGISETSSLFLTLLIPLYHLEPPTYILHAIPSIGARHILCVVCSCAHHLSVSQTFKELSRSHLSRILPAWSPSCAYLHLFWLFVSPHFFYFLLISLSWLVSSFISFFFPYIFKVAGLRLNQKASALLEDTLPRLIFFNLFPEGSNLPLLFSSSILFEEGVILD